MSILIKIFRRPDFDSDVTQFLNKLKTERPEVEAGQVAGRALLWDKAIDREAQKGWREARVPQKPYVYQSNTQ